MKYKCPNNCEVEHNTPFYYPACCTGEELGVLAYNDGTPSNNWCDGVTGVAQEVLEQLEDHDYSCLHCVECHAELEANHENL